jgi:ABC-2 type transport system permease protein
MLLLTPALLTLLLPLQLRDGFLDTPLVLVLTMVTPTITVGMTVPESFAGERERHTLETLLASRLPDRAILHGKLLVPVLFAWAVAATAHGGALAVFNAANWNGEFQVHPPTLLAAIVGFGLLLPLITAGVGVIISLRAPTVQQAEQLLVLGLLVPVFLLQVLGAVLLGMGRERARALIDFLEGLNWPVALAAALVILAAAAILLLWAAETRFQRSRLMVDAH